jgi:hypothetical protein
MKIARVGPWRAASALSCDARTTAEMPPVPDTGDGGEQP